MIRLILSSLFLTTVNCQLAYVWLNYHHFQCSQNIKNYRESIRHQYVCTSNLIRTCISDVNVYSHNSVIFVNYFCGFIDGQNALQPHTIWNIHLKPNINIHFLKFVLFDYYWYCDYEYLKVYSNNKTSTFCGNRIPWVYDASDTKVKIIFRTQRTGSKNYQMELLYYGAHAFANYQHFIIFTPSSSVISIHYPNTDQNAFESFHFISHNRLDIMELEAMNTCNSGQVSCHDGPGIKSPVLQFTYNQSIFQYLSSTFQMMCKFLRVDDVCTGARLHYRAIRARDEQVKTFIVQRKRYYNVENRDRNGTAKDVFLKMALSDVRLLYMDFYKRGSPCYMLSEGNSCMYGGIYVIQSNESTDSEILSLCGKINDYDYFQIPINDLFNISVVVIHYSEYSNYGMAVKFAFYLFDSGYPLRILTAKYKENTASIAAPIITRDEEGTIYSHLLKLRKIHYIIISCDGAVVDGISFYSPSYNDIDGFLSPSCMNIIIFYSPRASNIRGRRYDQETIFWHSVHIYRRDFIRSVFINMTLCTGKIPKWAITITMNAMFRVNVDVFTTRNFTHTVHLPVDMLAISYVMRRPDFSDIRPFWILIHMLKPEDVPAYAIWRVTMRHQKKVSHVAIEVLTDDHSSSSVFEWHNFTNPDVYITVEKAVTIHLESREQIVVSIVFRRRSIYDKMNNYVTGQVSQQSHFSFHNQR